MAQIAENEPLKVHHAHTDTHVVLALSRPVDNLQMTLEQAEAFITRVRESMDMLRAHQLRPATPGSTH